MEIDKNMIVSMLRERGDSEKASQAQQELPDKVDTERDSGMLQRFGVDPSELMSKFGGGQGLPGM